MSTLAFPKLSETLERSSKIAPPNIESRKRALEEDLSFPARKRRDVEHFPVDPNLLDTSHLEDWGDF